MHSKPSEDSKLTGTSSTNPEGPKQQQQPQVAVEQQKAPPTTTTTNEVDSDLKYMPSAANVGASGETIPRTKSRELLLQKAQQEAVGDSDQYWAPEDVCFLAFLCPTHVQMALVETNGSSNKGLFLPYVEFNSFNGSVDAAIDKINRVTFDKSTVKFRNLMVTSVDRVQLPKHSSFVWRFFHRVEVSNAAKVKDGVCICERTTSNKSPIVWHTYDEVCARLAFLAGPEPKFLFNHFNAATASKSKTAMTKRNKKNKRKVLSPKGNNNIMQADHFREFTVEDAINLGSDTDRSELVSCARLGPPEVFSLYNEFVLHCYPSRSMSQPSFGRFLTSKLALPSAQINEPTATLSKYFKSFDADKSNYIAFGELMQGLAVFRAGSAATTTACAHPRCHQAKIDHVFRFHSTNAKHITSADLCELIGGNAAQLKTLAEKHQLNLDTGVTFEQYQSLVSSGAIPTMPKSLELNFKLDRIQVIKRVPSTLAQTLATRHWPCPSAARCLSCSRIKFHLSSQLIELSEIGEIGDIKKIDPTDDPTHNLAKEFNASKDLDESDIHVLANDLRERIKRFAQFMYNVQDMTAELMATVDNWFFPSKTETISYLSMIANEAEDIFTREPRVLDLSGPCYVFGDIHGNLRDLIIYSNNLWRTSPFINQGVYLFTGDYVDRGPFGVECVILLFCMKILAPNNFYLLRGNHEVRDIQEQFSFWRECTTRFTEDLWDMINMAFDRLPLAAVVDGKIFCSHGGIPASVNTLDQMRTIPSPLEHPQMQAIEAWEILWNDPISRDDFARLSSFEQRFGIESSGFARNTKRGTAMMYTESAVQQFLKRNQVSLVVRAHEVFEDGFRFFHRGLVLSIFSCSKYVDLNNRAVALYLNGSRVRIIRLSTDEEE